jgi:hypothetical protein
MTDETTVMAVLVSLLAVAAVWLLSSRSGSPTSRSDVIDAIQDRADNQRPGFSEEIVNETGFLPSGFDAAGRVGLINDGEQVGL